MSVSSVRTGAELGGIVGGYAPLDSGLLVPRAYLPQVAGLLHNMAATAAPTVNEDSGDGYGVGSFWFDTTNDQAYVCLDATVTAAVWRRIGTSDWVPYTPTVTGSTTNPTLGSTTVVGRWRYVAPKLIHVRVEMAITTGGAWNAGSGEWRFSLPGSFTGTFIPSVGQVHIIDSGTARYAGTCLVTSGVGYIGPSIIADASGTRTLANNVPVIWATGDAIDLDIHVEIA